MNQPQNRHTPPVRPAVEIDVSQSDILYEATNTALWFHQNDVPHTICGQLQADEKIGVRTADQLRLVLHELIRNAIEHGCLNLGENFNKRTMNDAIAFYSAMDRRIKDPLYTEKPIHVRIWKVDNRIYGSVADKGRGFNWRSVQGLGLSLVKRIVQRLTYVDAGRVAIFAIDEIGFF